MWSAACDRTECSASPMGGGPGSPTGNGRSRPERRTHGRRHIRGGADRSRRARALQSVAAPKTLVAPAQGRRHKVVTVYASVNAAEIGVGVTSTPHWLEIWATGWLMAFSSDSTCGFCAK